MAVRSFKDLEVELPSVTQLTGLNTGHVVTAQDLCADRFDALLHPSVLGPLLALRDSAADAGFDLRVASGFRDYARQLAIWNAKARGERPVLDRNEVALCLESLSREQLLFGILHWSAIPGCSRHHWGTDLDVYDAAAVGADYRLQLSCAECGLDGPFFRLHNWLDERIAGDRAYGFFRPYQNSSGAVAREPWHLSWAPLARLCQASLSAQSLQQAALSGEPELSDEIMRHFATIYDCYIDVDVAIYPPAYRMLPTNRPRFEK